MDLSNLEIFSEVFRLGSFSAAARKRRVSPSSISRAVASLEAELGTRLFHRTTRKFAPTEAANLLADRAHTHLEALHSLRNAIAEAGDAPSGVLRVSASHSFGIKCLGPAIPEFRARYPEVNIDLSLTDRRVDIVDERFDLVIRHGPLPDSRLIARPILRTRYHACASAAYLRKKGRPAKPSDIGDLDCLTFPLPGFATVWRFRDSKGRESEVPVRNAMSTNSGLILRECALRGAGVVLLSDWIVGDDIAAGRLVDLFPAYRATPTNFQTAISAVYSSRAHTPKKVEAFVSFLQKYFRSSRRANG